MSDTTDTGYKVLARKYRPETFADLVGQEPMVRTLKNAFAADRIAQAFIMTGIRGTGKTTTARIIAKGINCIGLDGQGGPTTDPCGECEHCTAITEGRHVDVMEMDAASRTGVGDIREIIDSVHYRAASARYKIYIIDEVHMLSTNAFNALLKTLEEPPAHVKFIFATTEIRKVPVTVLSRCQRFDLRRIEPEVMITLMRKIAAAEGGEISDDALALITRASEGSARDATSLLDQALSHGAGETSVTQVRAMLGLADRGRVLDLFDMIMRGDAASALQELSGQYADGADPLAVLRDMSEITHWVSVIKITPEAVEDPTVSPDERLRGAEMAEKLPMRSLTRMWQMLLKALEEVAAAPNAMMAAEMAVIRLTHVADLPSPEELVRKLQNTLPPPMPPQNGGHAGGPAGGHTGGAGGAAPMGARSSSHSGSTMGHGATAHSAGALSAVSGHQTMAGNAGGATTSHGNTAAALDLTAETALARYASFDDIIDLIRLRRDVKLLVEVETTLRLARYSPGRIEFQPTENAPRNLASNLASNLMNWTGQRWAVTLVNEGGAPTIAEVKDAAWQAEKAEVRSHPLVSAVFDAFPKAKITEIRSAAELSLEAAVEALPEVDDEWDPFEEE
jgi:DNA polymerase III subunit gamma/tau